MANIQKGLEPTYVALMKRAASLGPEDGHIEADKLLCRLLGTLGYVELVKEYKSLSKWYS